jgi:NOL1/NOP2/sun family putative RNA methylase
MGHELTGNEITQQSLRVNTLKTTIAEVKQKFSNKNTTFEKIDWLRDGFNVAEAKFSLGATIEYLLGLYSIQEAAAQLPVEVMAPEPFEMVLDMCAAPGGKTTQISAWMNNQGVLIAVDSSRRRLYSLENHLERCGVQNCITFWGNAAEIDYGNIYFDKIMLDAPCSGNFVTDPYWFRKRTLKDISKNSEEQRKLLSAALRHLKHDGVLIYTTCSLEPEENEFNIQWILDNYSIELKSFAGPGSPGLTEWCEYQFSKELSKTMRFWPDINHTQGFYVAKVVKK